VLLLKLVSWMREAPDTLGEGKHKQHRKTMQGNHIDINTLSPRLK